MVTLRWTSVYLFSVVAALVTSASYDDYDYDPSYHDDTQGWTCYACEYGMEDGEPVGSEECGFDFRPEDLPRNPCSDFCSIDMTITSSESQDFSIHRGCSKHCEEVNNNTRKTKCCKSNLCNHGGFQAANNWASGSTSLPWIFVGLLLFGHSLLRSRFQN